MIGKVGRVTGSIEPRQDGAAAAANGAPPSETKAQEKQSAAPDA